MTDVNYVGGKVFVVTRPETTFGTDVGSGDEKLQLATNWNAGLKNNMLMIYTLGGGRSYQQIVPGKFEVSGSFEFEVQNLNFLRYAFGAISVATTTTTNFDGTTITGSPTAALKRYAVTQSDNLTSFTQVVYAQSDASATDVKHIITGTKINQISLKADTENPLHGTADWISQKPVTSTGDYSAAVTTAAYRDTPHMFYRGQLLIGSGDYGLTGTGSSNTMTDASKAWTVNAFQTNWVLIDSLGAAFVISSNTATALTVVGTPTTGKYVIVPLSTVAGNQVVQCNSIDATLTNNLESYWSINNSSGRGVQYLIEKQREYTLTLDLNFVNVEILGRFYNGAISGTTPTTTSDYTKFMVVVDYKTAIGDGDNYKAFKLVFSDCVIDEENLPANPKDILKQTLTFKARDCMAFAITNEVQ
jgi:hypothetical protein